MERQNQTSSDTPLNDIYQHHRSRTGGTKCDQRVKVVVSLPQIDIDFPHAWCMPLVVDKWEYWPTFWMPKQLPIIIFVCTWNGGFNSGYFYLLWLLQLLLFLDLMHPIRGWRCCTYLYLHNIIMVIPNQHTMTSHNALAIISSFWLNVSSTHSSWTIQSTFYGLNHVRFVKNSHLLL